MLSYIYLLNAAIKMAVDRHLGQTDKAGEPYILHPLRVMVAQKTNEARIVGVLHDIVEDTNITLEYLTDTGFPEHIVQAIDNITKREGEGNKEYYDRVKQSPLSVQVKLADLEDNMNLDRIKGEPTKQDISRTAFYKEKHEMLIKHCEDTHGCSLPHIKVTTESKTSILREGNVKKGGLGSKPTTPKQNIVPPALPKR